MILNAFQFFNFGIYQFWTWHSKEWKGLTIEAIEWVSEYSPWTEEEEKRKAEEAEREQRRQEEERRQREEEERRRREEAERRRREEEEEEEEEERRRMEEEKNRANQNQLDDEEPEEDEEEEEETILDRLSPQKKRKFQACLLLVSKGLWVTEMTVFDQRFALFYCNVDLRIKTADWLFPLAEYGITMWEVAGSNPDQTNTQCL